MILLAAYTAHADPMPGLTRSKTELRRLDCERMGMREGAERYPGRIVASESRAVDPDRSWVVCTERLAPPGLRAPGDEALLSGLGGTATTIATAAATARPEWAGRTWEVEVWTVNPAVGNKVAFAVKNALVGAGLPVSDRVPALSAADVPVSGAPPPLDACPAACARYAATGALPAGHVLLGVVQLDPRATTLVSRTCADGRWSWSR